MHVQRYRCIRVRLALLRINDNPLGFISRQPDGVCCPFQEIPHLKDCSAQLRRSASLISVRGFQKDLSMALQEDRYSRHFISPHRRLCTDSDSSG